MGTHETCSPLSSNSSGMVLVSVPGQTLCNVTYANNVFVSRQPLLGEMELEGNGDDDDDGG